MSSARMPQFSRNNSYSHYTQTYSQTQVRALWRKFEQSWVQPRYAAMRKRKEDVVKEEDRLWRATPAKNRTPTKDHQATKEKKLGDIEMDHYVAARKEWLRLVQEANLGDDAWGDMSAEEEEAINKALGAHLLPEDSQIEQGDQQDAIQHSLQTMHNTASYVQSQQLQASTSSLSSSTSAQPPQTPQTLQPPPTAMSSSSRAANFSNNSYEFVNPEMFGSDDDDALFKMPPKEIISEDEDIGIPLRAGWSTESSGYTTTWSMSSSRGGSTQSSNQGSPEFGGGNVLPQPVASTSAFSSSLLHSRVSSEDAPKRSSSGGSQERDQNQQEKPTSSTTTTTTTSSLTIAKQRIPGPSYIGPVLTTLSEPTDEESEFEKFKMQIRIQKIIEFHQEAARAGIKLALDIHNAHKAASRDLKGKSRDDAVKVAEHERFMRELQVVKEEERRRVVGEERERRRAEIKKRGRGRGEKGKSGEVLEEGEFEVDLEAQFGVDEIVRGVRGAKVFSASVSSSASASAAASPTEERFQDLYSTPSSFSSYMDHGHWEPPQQTKSSSPSGMQTRNSMRVLPPVQRDEEEEEYEGEEEEIPSDIMAALVAGGGLETQQDWLFGSSSTSTSTSASAASSMASSLANPLASFFTNSISGSNTTSSSSSAAAAAATAKKKGPTPPAFLDDMGWDKGKARESTGAGVAGLGAWGGRGQGVAMASKESEGVWGKSKGHLGQLQHQQEEGVWGKSKAQLAQHQQEEDVWGKSKAQVAQVMAQTSQESEGVWGKTKAQLAQSQEEGVWGKTKAQLLSQESEAPWGELKRGIVHPPTSATPVQSGWKKPGTASATPVQSGWAAKEGRSTPSLFGEAEDTIASKLGMRGQTVSAMKASFANNNPLRKGSLLADETPVMGKMTPSATPSAPIPVTKQKMSKKQRQQAIKKGFNVEDLDGEEEAEHEGYKSSDLLSTPRPSKAPFFEQWDEGPSTPRPFQTRGLSQVPELSGRPEPVHRPSGLRNEIPVATQASESSGEFWMPGAAKGNWTEPEQAAADMWAPAGAAKAANGNGKQFWNSMLKEKTVPTPQAGIRTPGRKSAFEAPQESASMLRKGKAVKGKAKPVMVEEVPDEEDEPFDNLPVDSRYILEPKQPKPQAPPTAFDNIISYQPDNGEEEDEEDDEEEYDDMGWSSNAPTPSTARTSPPEAIDIDGVDPHWLEQASRNLQMSNAKMEKLFGGADSGTVKAKLAPPQTRWGTSLGQAHDSSSSSSSASSPFFTDSEQYKSPFEMLGNKRAVPTKAPEPPKIPTPPKAAPKVSPAPPAPAPAPPAPAPKAAAQASTPIEKAKAPVKPEPESKKNNKPSKGKGKGRR